MIRSECFRGFAGTVRVKEQIDRETGELRCPRCLRKDLVPSQQRGIRDWIMQRMGKIPRHCRSCEKRFYVAEETLKAIDRAIGEARQAYYQETARKRKPPMGPEERRAASASLQSAVPTQESLPRHRSR
jgi:hypothetical protein